MANDESSSEPEAPRRRRPATTIDLPASEISAPSTSDGADTGGGTTSEQSTETSATPESAPPPRNRPWPMLATVMAGAAIILSAVTALSLFGIIRTPEDDTSDMAARLARLESAVAARNSADTKLPDDIAARLTKIESTLATPNSAGGDSALGARFNALEISVKTLVETLATLKGRSDDSAAALREARSHIDATEKAISDLRLTLERQRDASSDKSELERMAGRIAAVETATKTVQQEIDPRDGMTDRVVRRALLASAVRDKILRGAPFAIELTAIKILGGDTASLSTIEPFAAQGLPSTDKLCAELIALLPKLNPPSANPPNTGSFSDRLLASANRLIQIRPIGEAAGDDNGAIVGRVEAQARRADVDGALKELLRLPVEMRAPANDWIAKAQARQAAVAAGQDVATNALNALAQTVQPQ